MEVSFSDFLSGLGLTLGIGLLVIAAVTVVALVVMAMKKPHAKGHDEHGDDHDSHDSHGHGLVHTLWGWTKAALVIIGILAVFYYGGRRLESEADQSPETATVSRNGPDSTFPVPTSGPVPCGPSEQELAQFRIRPGATSPWLRPVNVATHTMGLSIPDDATYQICTERTCYQAGETIDVDNWYVWNKGEREFTMNCWLNPVQPTH